MLKRGLPPQRRYRSRACSRGRRTLHRGSVSEGREEIGNTLLRKKRLLVNQRKREEGPKANTAFGGQWQLGKSSGCATRAFRPQALGRGKVESLGNQRIWVANYREGLEGH